MGKRTRKPTYHQMFDWLANKYGYKRMLELRDSGDPQAVAKAFEEAKRQEAKHG